MTCSFKTNITFPLYFADKIQTLGYHNAQGDSDVPHDFTPVKCARVWTIFIDLLCYQHFPKSQPHYVEKSLQRNCLSSVGTTAESNVNRFSIKTEKVHFENFLQSETLFGVNRSYKTPTEKKKSFSRILTLMLSFFLYVSSLCACLRVHPIKCLLVVIATLFSLQLRSWGFRERSMIFTSKSGHIFNWLLKRNDFRNNWTRNIVILIYSAFHSNPFLQVSKTVIMSSFTDC